MNGKQYFISKFSTVIDVIISLSLYTCFAILETINEHTRTIKFNQSKKRITCISYKKGL